MHRLAIASILLALLVSPALADALLIEQNGRLKVLGMPSESDLDGREITPENYKLYLDESYGEVVADNYDGIIFRARSGSKKLTTYPLSMVRDVQITTQPEALLNGYDLMATGNYAGAISEFRVVFGDPQQALVFRFEAMYQIGRCFIGMGNYKQAIQHYSKWDRNSKSKYTPQVFSLLAEMETLRKRYDQARGWYDMIGKLDKIPAAWAYKARLGGVKVDIAERQYDKAESRADATASRLEGKRGLTDPLALAYALQGQAVYASGDKERFPEAQAVLEKAMELEEVSPENRAFVCARLGDVVYAQGKPEAARFHYMRIVTMYPGANEVAHGLRNAGQCFLDMSDRAKNRNEQAASDDLLVKGMKLLAECAGRFKGSAYGTGAAKVYVSRKAAYEQAQKRTGK